MTEICTPYKWVQNKKNKYKNEKLQNEPEQKYFEHLTFRECLTTTIHCITLLFVVIQSHNFRS